MKWWKILVCGLILLTGGCSIWKWILAEPVVKIYTPIEPYKYVVVPSTGELKSYFNNVSKKEGEVEKRTVYESVCPSDVVAGVLLKHGFVRLPSVKPEWAGETLIVNYGESGGDNGIVEVTIQFVSAQTYEVVALCTADGGASMRADAVRQAIVRALSGLFPE